ncbi:hypothetical protein LG293_16130 (plasmid) [Citricoccus nitrophenolicus]
MSTIWPDELRNTGRTPARLDGRTIVMAVDRGDDIGPIIHAAPRPAGATDAFDRMAAVLASLGRTDTDGESSGLPVGSSVRTSRVDGVRLVAMEMPDGPGVLHVDDTRPDGVPWVSFWEPVEPCGPDFQDEAPRLDVYVHDPTLELPSANLHSGLHRRRWDVADRDRFLDWIGATPLVVNQ